MSRRQVFPGIAKVTDEVKKLLAKRHHWLTASAYEPGGVLEIAAARYLAHGISDALDAALETAWNSLNCGRHIPWEPGLRSAWAYDVDALQDDPSYLSERDKGTLRLATDSSNEIAGDYAEALARRHRAARAMRGAVLAIAAVNRLCGVRGGQNKPQGVYDDVKRLDP